MNIPDFTLEFPRNVHFGPGSRHTLKDILNPGKAPVAVLTGQKWLSASGWKGKIAPLLPPETHWISCPPGEPEVRGLGEVMEVLKQIKPSFLVAIGGGSVLDTAKAAAALVSREEPVEDFMEGIGRGLVLDTPGVPFIAIPTTSGTGSEGTKNAVIKSLAHKVKKSIRSPFMLAEHVIIDPEFTMDLDRHITGMTGMDALVQLLESFLSRKARPVPSALVKDAFMPMLRGLKILARDLKNLNARTTTAYGSFISGVALANAGLGAVHGFASSLGGLTEMPHGLICALFLSPVLEANKEVISSRLEELTGLSGEKAFSFLKGEIEELIALFGLDELKGKYRITGEMIPEIARMARGSSMSGNPRELSQKEKEDIARAVFNV